MYILIIEKINVLDKNTNRQTHTHTNCLACFRIIGIESELQHVL